MQRQNRYRKIQSLTALALMRLAMFVLNCSIAVWKLSRVLRAKALTLAARSSGNA